jgi:leader peptidase (prepilin peptidase)/N-methyltransferase
VNGWNVVACAASGFLLGAAASLTTRRFLRMPTRVAHTWWLGAIVTAVVLAVLGWRVGARGELAVYAFVVTLGVPLAVIDWVEHRLPRIVVWPQLIGAVLGFGVLCLVRADAGPGVRAVWAMFAAAGLYLLLAVLVAGGVGSGDVSLAAVIGVVVGWSGWSELAAALLVASVLALVLLLAPRVRRRGDGDHVVVPFGPCLLAGMAVVVAVAAG